MLFRSADYGGVSRYSPEVVGAEVKKTSCSCDVRRPNCGEVTENSLERSVDVNRNAVLVTVHIPSSMTTSLRSKIVPTKTRSQYLCAYVPFELTTSRAESRIVSSCATPTVRREIVAGSTESFAVRMYQVAGIMGPDVPPPPEDTGRGPPASHEIVAATIRVRPIRSRRRRRVIVGGPKMVARGPLRRPPHVEVAVLP